MSKYKEKAKRNQKGNNLDWKMNKLYLRFINYKRAFEFADHGR